MWAENGDVLGQDDLRYRAATLSEQIDAIRNFFRYLAGVKHQVRRVCAIKTTESLIASL
jgi:hypothetical protein